QGCAGHPGIPCGAGRIAVVMKEHALDVAPLHVLHALRPEATASRRTPRGASQLRRQVIPAQLVRARAEDERPLQDVPHLTNIPRPRVGDQPLHRVVGDARGSPGDVLPQLVQQGMQQRDAVFGGPLAHRREMERSHVQSIEEILPERSPLDRALQLAVTSSVPAPLTCKRPAPASAGATVVGKPGITSPNCRSCSFATEIGASTLASAATLAEAWAETPAGRTNAVAAIAARVR